MIDIAKTPSPPYYAVIFTSLRTEGDDGYGETAVRMLELAAQQLGFLGVESARESAGITVSYWADLDSIKNWKQEMEHLAAQERGQAIWYEAYKVRIAKVERDYDWQTSQFKTREEERLAAEGYQFYAREAAEFATATAAATAETLNHAPNQPDQTKENN